MLVKVVYAVCRVLALLAFCGCLFVATVIMLSVAMPTATASSWILGPIALLAGLCAAVVVHETGHLLACLALRVKVLAVEIGSGKSAWLRFTVGGAEVSLGPRLNGRVRHASGGRGRDGLIGAAGPLANLIAAAALFPFGRLGNYAVLVLALFMAVTGVGNLLPYQERSGRFTDGARLLGLIGGQFAAALRVPDAKGWRPLGSTPAALHAEYKELLRHGARQLSPEQTARWLKAYREREPLALHTVGLVGRSLRQQGRISELLALHADLPRPAGPSASQLTVVAHTLDRQVLLVPGLPATAVNLAVARVESTLRTAEFKPAGQPWSREVALHTLALGRLRQGKFAEAEELCQPVLALPRPGAGTRATALATVALARRAAGLPYEAELAEARSLAPDADLVGEAMEPASAKAPNPGQRETRQAQGA